MSAQSYECRNICNKVDVRVTISFLLKCPLVKGLVLV